MVLHQKNAERSHTQLCESEKNLKAVFKEYNYTIKNQVKCPILFLNEADALISKRVDINTSVDQMSNTMQNILLQELEDFEGILCATTNLLDNIDAAFERRFLYKTKFEKPGVIERSKIWQSRFGILNENDAIDLANQFELSGAEIENISRKMQIESVLFNKAIDLENIVSHCKEERYNDSLNKNQIGFMKNQ
jgi:SpoVK/Ycf46/Vps4 family AAA+-type ATPase